MWVAVISRWLIKADGVKLSVTTTPPFFFFFKLSNHEPTWETCDRFLSLRYTECDVWRLVCLSMSGCWRSPSCRRPTWTNCRSRLKGERVKLDVAAFIKAENCVTPIQDGTCVILFFISDAEHRLHPTVGFTHAVAAAHVSADIKQKDAKY